MAAEEVVTVTSQAGDAGLAAAHRAMLRTRDLQFDFTAIKAPEPPTWLEPLARFFQAIAPFLKLLFWAGLAVGAGLVLYFIARELMRVRFKPRERPAAESVADWRPEPRRARALLADADRLAAEGRYDEAVRLILHRGIDEFDERRPGSVRPALTSREIAVLTAMPQSGRAAFEAMARAVEASFFAARPAGAPDFAACRQAYERFAFPQVWA